MQQPPRKPPLTVRLMHWVRRHDLISERRALELYPPFFFMRIKVLEISDDWRHVRIRLPLNGLSRNPGGVMFGGYQAALADPVAALACANAFPDHDVWTRAMTVDFRHGGTTDLELRFDFPADREAAIREELLARGRATPEFEYGFHLEDGTLCTRVLNTVAIRPKGYALATSAPVARDEL